jgi:tRNA-modifying protein YgfZ
MTRLVPLPDRAVLSVTGEDRVAFLQGLVSNDVAAVAPGRAAWAALLTPQGKFLFEFFVFSDGGSLLLDAEAAGAAELARRLLRFRLRARAAVEPAPLRVHAAWDGMPEVPPGAVAAPDPRLPEAGWRVLAPAPLLATATAEDWDRHRLALGLPDGSRDLEPEKTVLLEAGFDELGGVSWSKGCYMGQELTARTKYRGLVKRRLLPVAVQGPLPAPGTPVLRDGREVGTMRSGRDGLGLAVLRIEEIGAAELRCAEATLLPRVPDWLRLPAEAPRAQA